MGSETLQKTQNMFLISAQYLSFSEFCHKSLGSVFCLAANCYQEDWGGSVEIKLQVVSCAAVDVKIRTISHWCLVLVLMGASTLCDVIHACTYMP